MVLKVDTLVEQVKPYIPRLRFLTLLGTAIGVKDQRLNERAGVTQRVILAADGGIRDHTVPLLRQSGAETFCSGL